MRFFWDIYMTVDDVQFFCTVPEEKASFIKQQLAINWEKATIMEDGIALRTTF